MTFFRQNTLYLLPFTLQLDFPNYPTLSIYQSFNLSKTMTLSNLNSIKVKFLLVLVISVSACCFTSCKSDVSMKKQQKAFYVDDKGDLLDKKGNVVKKEGDFKLEGGYYVDENGDVIQRKIDKTKEKINQAVDKTKEAVSDAASATKEGVKSTFKELFNTKAVGTAYTLPEITFDKTSHRITGMSKAEVEGLADALKEHPDARIQVQVHSADGKNRAESKKISKLRAEVVKSMLVTLGVDEKQISSKGMGLTVEDAEKAVENKVEVIVEK